MCDFRSTTFLRLATLACLVCAVLVSTVCAGGGPENVILVVNQNSRSSMAIANLYIELRQIPPSNVVYLSLPFAADADQISLVQFRDAILNPIINEIHARHLDSQIDYIVYSADFPTVITINEAVEQLKKDRPNLSKEEAKLYRAYASINSMTYFAGAVIGNNNSFLSLDSNWYMRQKIDDAIGSAFVGDENRNFGSALVFISSGDFGKALEFLQPLAKSNPLQFATRLQIVRCHAGLGQPKETARAILELAKTGWGHRKTILDFKEYERVASDAEVQLAIDSIPDEASAYLSSQSFRRTYLWGRNGGLNSSADQGRNYILSTVLAVTRNNGTSLDEALKYLRASAAADFTHPQGEFYFTLTNDVRTKTRQPGFDSAIAGLKQLGYKSEIVFEDVPTKKEKTLGAILGQSNVIWQTSQTELVPGAIVDNLTSYGAPMKGGSQTPATEFLKWGAAASSGTVIEPYALQFKFAHPMIMVHYARGCTVAEAYYQSVHAPFQLLILGDALCQPFATPVPFEVTGLTPSAKVNGKVMLEVTTANPARIDHYELFLDGIRSGINPRLGNFNFDADKISDGHHELRIVAVASGPIETRSRKIIPFIVDHHGGLVELVVEQGEVGEIGEIKLTAHSKSLGEIAIFQNGRSVGSIAKSGQSVVIPAAKLGKGKSQLIAIAPIDGKSVQSQPVTISVK